jgi:arsenate reductase-like glutaredoxin family protein
MALEQVPLRWFDKLTAGLIRNWDDLQRALCANFVGILANPPTRTKFKGCIQKKNESFRDYYRRFGELHAQVNEITDHEVIDDFAMGIRDKSQF